MKRFALISTAMAVAALALFSSSAALSEGSGGEPTTGVMYESWEGAPDGILRVANGGGEFIEVCAADGEMVWCGHVPADYFEVLCPNHGKGKFGEVLHVWTAGGAYYCIDRDEDWIWE